MISVALCTYNGAKYLSQQLDSILSQSMEINELIICDDHSTDKTWNIISTYKKKFPGIINTFRNEASLKTIKNFEYAISKTTGDFIFLSDQDDIWKPRKVETMIKYFEKDKNCSALFSNGELIDENGKDLHSTLWQKWQFSKKKQNHWLDNENSFADLSKNKNFITGATLAFRSSLKNNILPVNVPHGYWHDAWIGLHASAQNGLCFTQKKLVYYRVHPEQQIGLTSESNYSNDQFITPDHFEKILLAIRPGTASLKNKIFKKLKRVKKLIQ